MSEFKRENDPSPLLARIIEKDRAERARLVADYCVAFELDLPCAQELAKRVTRPISVEEELQIADAGGYYDGIM
jgi:hypothetical protein